MILEVCDLACGYNRDHIVQDHISFQMKDHEICCILGPNGVGKTTLFKTIMQFLRPLGGSIRMDGQDLSKWGPRQLAKHVAYVAQNHVPPFPYITEDVVMLGRVSSTGYFRRPTDTDRQIVEEAMKDMGVEHLRDRVYTDISGGERQLVMLARALAQQPRLLVLDEPIAELDYGNQVRVLRKICELRDRGYAIIMTTHAPDHAFLCNAVVVLLQRTKPALFGTAERIVTEKNLRDAYGIQVQITETYNENGMIRTCSPLMNRRAQLNSNI